MNINHVFKAECINAEELFKDCADLITYINRLKIQAPYAKTQDYIKHGFEALIEAIIKCEKRAMRIKKYTPLATCNDDLYVNGIGEKDSGSKIAVMINYVEDENMLLTSNGNHITTFADNSVTHYGVDINEPKGLRVFSNSIGLHENTKENYFNDKSVAFYCKAELEAIINDNQKFWMKFKNMMKFVTKNNKKNIVLRKYQKIASDTVFSNTKGQVILPTGTGKSLIAIDAIYNEIKYSDNRSPCIMIMTPRIVLTYQLLGETISYLKDKGVDAQYLNLNSGKFDDDSIKSSMADSGLPIRDIPSTTNSKEIQNWYNKAIADKVPLIISATYQSASRILTAGIPIHLAVHDEAHNLVDGIGRFSTEAKMDVLTIPASKKMFFTATPALTRSPNATDTKEVVKGTGMDNEENYGKVIYKCSAKDMIDAGEIVPPYIHQVIIDEYKLIGKHPTIQLTAENLMNTDIEKNVEFMGVVIEESFDAHLKKIKEYSCSPEKIGAKMLVVCKGEDVFSGFFESDIFKSMKEKRKDIKFYGISSRFGAWIDGEKVDVQGGWYKEQFMLALRNLKPEENAIILHIDMMGEGVDLPGITGVLPFRDLGTIKSSQTLGRAMRLVSEDRISLYNNSREPRDTTKMIKPFAWVIIPIYSINHKDMECKVMELARRIRDDYGFMPFELGHGGTVGSSKEVFDTGSIATGKPVDEITLRHKVEDPYFSCLTTKAINDSVNGNDEDFFEIIRRTLKIA